MKNFYITTPIFYPSGNPHLGHAYSALYASLLSEYKKLIGYDSYYLTGTDEHGQKIEETAKKENITPQELVNKNSKSFIDLWEKMGIKYDQFIRTTQLFHKEAVQKTFDILLKKGYIYLGNWEGLYCVSCEENYTETNAIKEENVLKCIHGHKLITKNEESYFLKISLFNEWIINFLSNNSDFLYPQNRAKELINNFLIDNKLEDLSITRTTFDWGIKTLNDPKHVVYVWLDALMNYITALGYNSNNDELLKKYWISNESYKVHLIGKEITRFHCIYWPIILKMLDLPLPNKIISHGWIITDTGKMSKSLGNVINPNDVINKYGRDAFRYFLIKEISLKDDSVFSDQKFVTTYNTNLANNYGNIVNRTIGMIKKYNNGIIPKFTNPTKEKDINILKLRETLVKECINDIENLKLNELINHVNDFENEINLYIENTKPWELKSNNLNNDLNIFLSIVANCVKTVIIFLKPILIDASLKSINQFSFSKEVMDIKNINNLSLIDELKVNDPEILFQRIN